MKDNIRKFEKNWQAFNTPGEGSEVHIDLLIDLAKQDSEVLELAKLKFDQEQDDEHKLYLAMIAVNSGLREPYIEYLKEVHDWEDSDFEDFQVSR